MSRNDFVSGRFLTCTRSFSIFRKGGHYWLEYVGNDNYIGRSDNILNERIHIAPDELFNNFTK